MPHIYHKLVQVDVSLYDTRSQHTATENHRKT